MVRRPLALLLTLSAVLITGLFPATGAVAADRSQFDPGNIIADAVFFDAGAMSQADVAAFIEAKGAGCQASSNGTPCLKGFYQDTWTRTASGCPNTYQGTTGEHSSAIIWKVAQACGVNPRVLLVLLQKEQSLLTASGSALTSTRYRSATGYGCPDTAPCDAEYFGFFNQVFMAARQFRLYAVNPARYGYVSGQNNTIQFHPNASCGSSGVIIRNQATAGLYNYTPYQPNRAVLSGSPDSCSSYGNLNFWTFFTDWWGTTQWPYAVTGDFLTLWSSLGYSSSVLGRPTTTQQYGIKGGGTYQEFAGGSIYASSASGMHYVTTPFRSAWGRVAWEAGPLGYPVSDPIGGLRDGGSFQNFQGGAVHYSPATGAYATRGAVYALWAQTSWESGPLGYPTSDLAQGLRDSGSYQDFAGGSIYSAAATGTHYVTKPFHAAWGRLGWENGPLGYPTAEPVDGLTNGGTSQAFAGGAIWWSPAAGAHPVLPAVQPAWLRVGAEKGTLGYPNSDLNTGLRNGGAYQDFTGGSIYTSPATGAHSVPTPIHAAWGRVGWENGALGYPATDLNTGLRNGGAYQDFTGGSIYTSPATGAHSVPTPIHAAWGRVGWESGALGYPTTDQIGGLRNGGSFQNFQGGAIHYSPATGAHATRGQIYAQWAAQGWESGPLGYPTGDAVVGRSSITQQFEYGTLTSPLD